MDGAIQKFYYHHIYNGISLLIFQTAPDAAITSRRLVTWIFVWSPMLFWIDNNLNAIRIKIPTFPLFYASSLKKSTFILWFKIL